MSVLSESQLTFNDGYLLNKDRLYLAAQPRDVGAAVYSRAVVVVSADWQLTSIEDVLLTVTCLDNPPRGFFVGHSGKILVTGYGKCVEERIPYSEVLGTFLRARTIAGEIYVCGMSGQVYYRKNEVWQPLHHNIVGTLHLDFEDIGGTDVDNIYAVSSFGQMLHFNGTDWTDIDIPTNRPLSGVTVNSEGDIYACGDNGILMRGNQHGFGVLTDSSFDMDFWAVEEFLGQIYLAHDQGLVVFDMQNGFREVDFGVEETVECHRLTSHDNLLYSIGPDVIMQFDGSKWVQIVCPSNIK